MEIRGRASDALDKCSKRAIRDGRVAEIKQAILNSKKLQVRFPLTFVTKFCEQNYRIVVNFKFAKNSEATREF